MNSNNYLTLSNYTGYLKTIPSNTNTVYNISTNSYPEIPSAYQFIVQKDNYSSVSKENFARLYNKRN